MMTMLSNDYQEIKRLIEKLSLFGKKLEAAAQSRDIRGQYTACNGLAERAEKLAVMMRSMVRDFPFQSDEDGIFLVPERFAGEESAPVEFSVLGQDTFRIKLPPLLPKRRHHPSAPTARQWYETMFGSRLYAFFEEHSWTGGAFTIWYHHCYKEIQKSTVKDFDNLETKALTDLFCRCLHADDHPEQFSCFVDGCETGEDCTEVYIVQRSRFAQLYTEITERG